MTRIEEYLIRYGWIGERIDHDTWRGVFTGENEADHDIYIMEGEDWVHFAVSPLFRRPLPENAGRLYGLMLKINQGLLATALAVDDDGDVNLVAALSVAELTYAQFAVILDVLTRVTVDLAPELQRIGADSAYQSARFG